MIHDGSGENVWMRQGAHLSRAQSFAPSHQHHMPILAFPLLNIIGLAPIGLLSAAEKTPQPSSDPGALWLTCLVMQTARGRPPPPPITRAELAPDPSSTFFLEHRTWHTNSFTWSVETLQAR